jgi:Nucleotidyl transferase AbiEii toxin, Type IV TA system
VKDGLRNVAASRRERLAQRAKSRGDVFDLVLRRFFFERFLYRLSISPASDRFVLKGAMLFQLWADQPYRSTVDLDLLRKGALDPEALVDDLRRVLSQPVDPDDGVTFDVDSLAVEPIRAEEEYVGVRARFVARLGAIRHRLQVDVGTGDAVWPAPKRVVYPVLLDDPAPRVLAYARETVIAEKVEAMVTLGIRNSRIKDFFDIHYLAAHFDFDGSSLCEALRRTLERRRTPIPQDVPVALTAGFWNDDRRATQLKAFARRARLGMDSVRPSDILPLLVSFLVPLVDALAKGATFNERWKAGGPWSERSPGVPL